MKQRFLFQLTEGLRHIGIFKRLMMAFFVVIFLPALIFGGFSIKNLAEQNRIRTMESTRSSLRNLDAALLERIKAINDVSYSLYNSRDLRQLLSGEGADSLTVSQREKVVGDILLSAKKRNAYIQNMEIVSDLKEYPCSPAEGSLLTYINDPAEFRESEPYLRAKESGSLPFWTNTVRQRSTYKLGRGNAYLGQYVTHTRGIFDSQGNFLGVIVANVSLDIFSDLLSAGEIDVGKGHVVLMGEGDIVSYLSADRNSNLIRREELAALLSGEQNSFVSSSNGQSYLVTAVSCQTTGWTLASLLPRGEVQGDLYELVRILVFITLTCLLLSLTMSYLVTVSITHPIQKLCTAMKNVELNAENLRYEDGAKDEVGRLGRDFDRMLKRNQELIHRVYTIQLEKKEESLLRKQAELEALQMQIDPHFLYNTLDIIRWQIMDGEEPENKASTMLMEFSAFLKLSTRRSPDMVPLWEEINHIKAYLRVVEFDVEYTISLNTDISQGAAGIPLPKLTLQPLVENAIVHGFVGRSDDAKIEISAERKPDGWYVSVTNNGAKLPPEKLEEINHQVQSGRHKGHIGLVNVNDRLRLHFGERYGLYLAQDSRGWTQAVIHLPGEAPDTDREGVDGNVSDCDSGR